MTQRNTAIRGFVGGLWAVEPSWLRSAVQVLQGHKGEIPQRNDDLALASRQGERPQGTRYTVLQDRTAVIDLHGVVMPRANFFSEWSGGTSCELLAKDIQWAVDNEAVENILLVIHSPGGEVTGVSELAELIHNARDKKNITAYVSGMGCSAAYWIASACSRVYANETAILGSIGVMSVYTDDTKQLEMIGLEEIEFVSSQSPYKNPDPKTSEGKKRIQARVNSLAQVFVENVARNRGVSAETVLKSFGQGDVFVGADAVKAGLADQIGNFGDALALIAKDFDGDIEGDDFAAAQLPTLAVENTKGATNMATENDKKQPQAAENDTVTVDKAEFDKMKSDIAALAAEKQSASELVETLKAEKLNAEITETAKTFAGDTETHVLVMTGIAETFGTDSKEYKSYVDLSKAITAQIEKSDLLKSVGSDKGGESKSALEELNEKAEAIAKAKGISVSDAFVEATEANQELYVRYNAERQTAQAA